MISDDVNVDGGLNDKRDEKDLENLLAGDSRAVWRIWRRYERDLGKICVRYLKSPADAEGAMGDLMLRIVDKLPHNAAKISNLRAWLKRLAVNLCLDRLRRRQGFRPLERDMRIESRTPERDLLTGESEEVIERLLGEISQSLREAFVLRFHRDLSYAEIADRLQISRAAARKRIERAREQLRAKLEASPRSGSEEPAAASPLRVGQASEIRRAPSVLRPVSITLESGVVLDIFVDVELRSARPETRLNTLNHYIEQHPKGWKKRLERAKLLYALGRWRKAIADYRFVLERNPREMNSRLAMGTALVALQRPADALKAFEDGLRCCVQKATKCHLQALVNWCRGSLEEAVPEIEKACRLDPSNPAHPYRLGRIHLENEHPLEALEAFDVVLGLCPDDTASLDHSCEALFQMGRLEEAFRRSRHSLRQDPHSIPALKRCVEYRCRARRVRRQEGTRIRQDIRKMLSWSSETAAVHQTLAGYHAGRGEWERALKVMRTLTARQPKNWLTWFYLAVWLRRAGQRAEAAAAILESHSLYRNDPRVHCAACPILAAAGRGVDKDRLVSEMISRFPSRWTVWTTAARELARQAHKEDKALSASQRALSLQPKLAQTWFTHGDILLRLGRSGEAAQHLGEAWRLMPKRQGNRQEPALAIRLAECFQSLSKGVETTGWLRRARRSAARLRRLDPPAAWLWEGRALELSGDAQGALRAYRKARSNQLFHPLRGWAEKAMQRLGGG